MSHVPTLHTGPRISVLGSDGEEVGSGNGNGAANGSGSAVPVRAAHSGDEFWRKPWFMVAVAVAAVWWMGRK